MKTLPRVPPKSELQWGHDAVVVEVVNLAGVPQMAKDGFNGATTQWSWKCSGLRL